MMTIVLGSFQQEFLCSRQANSTWVGPLREPELELMPPGEAAEQKYGHGGAVQ
jgi:hypothetical protein